jgi:hypothetical protein
MMSFLNFSWLWGGSASAAEVAPVATTTAHAAPGSVPTRRHHRVSGDPAQDLRGPSSIVEEPSPELRYSIRLEAERQELFKLIDYDPTQVSLMHHEIPIDSLGLVLNGLL